MFEIWTLRWAPTCQEIDQDLVVFVWIPSPDARSKIWRIFRVPISDQWIDTHVQNRIPERFVHEMSMICPMRWILTLDQMCQIWPIRWIPASGPLMDAPVQNRILDKFVR